MAVPSSSDVVICGGGAVGASTAFFLKHELGFTGTVTVIEKDMSFQRASTSLSASSIRLQFSTPENIQLSKFGVGFLKSMTERFGPEADPSFHERGYLILAAEAGKAVLEENNRIQLAEGARSTLLDTDGLAARFPWLNRDGLAVASFGEANEGWFDAATLHGTLRKAARTAGAVFIEDEVVGLTRDGARITAVTLKSGGKIATGTVVNAAGHAAGKLAAMAGAELPVEPRKRSVFVIHCPDAPPGMPLVTDATGIWIRPEGQFHITGWSPSDASDQTADPADFEPDYPIFEDILWPALAARVPAFETCKVVRAWAGLYDYNTLDQNAIIGRHPEITNLVFCNGFSGHGLQQSPASGRAAAELVMFNEFRAIDLTRFGYDRIRRKVPLLETNVY